MSQTASIWLVILLSAVAANLPFINSRLLAVVPLRGRRKSLALRLLELIICYALVGAVGMFLEASIGQTHPQSWQFYAITAALFATLAFPGFVYRYLVMRGD